MPLPELFESDRATTTISSGGTDAPSSGSSETWTAASSAMFGTAATGVSQFHVVDPFAPGEMIAVTNVSGTTWTVTRGAEGTTPVTHSAGFTVQQTVTAGWFGAAGAAAAFGVLAHNVQGYGATGNGTTDDTISIQAALNAASSGSTVWVPYTSAGYLCGALTIPAGVSFAFDNGAKLIAPAALAVSWLSAEAAVLHEGTAITGGTFDATAVTSANVNAVIDFHGTHGCPNLRIQGNRIINAPRHGMQLGEDAGYTTEAMKWVTGNSVEEHGVAGTGFGLYFDYIGNVLIDGNYCYTAGVDDNIELGHSGPAWLSGLDIHLRCTNNMCVGGQINYPFSDYAEIVNNTVTAPLSSSSPSGIQNDGNTANYVQIIGNRVFNATPGSQFAGISHWGTYGQIIGNYVSVTTGNGIGGSWSHEMVANNYITSTATPSDTGYAIYPGGGGAQNTVTGNVVLGNFATGLYASFSESAVTGNTFNVFDGIQANGVEHTFIMGNNFNVGNEVLVGTPGAGTVIIANAGGDGWGTLQLPVSVAAGAPLNIPPGAAPTSPNAGDIWNSGGTLSLNSALQVAGPVATALSAQAANYTMSATDSTVIASGSGTVITLPTAAGIAGLQYTVKRDDPSNAIGVATTSSQTIDGSTTLTLNANYMAVTVQSDGANWQVINQVATTVL